MKLQRAIKAQGHSIRSLAKHLGISYIHLWRICRGERYPSAKLAERIELALNGKVSRLELLYKDR